MKLLGFTGTLALVASAFAQTFQIAAPSPGKVLTIGKPFTVEVDQPVAIGIFGQVAVAIGLQSCVTIPCSITDNDGKLGQILFTGEYKPQRHEPFKPPYQNFTLTIPDGAEIGHAVLHVADFFLIGAGPFPELLTKNVSVTIKPAK